MSASLLLLALLSALPQEPVPEALPMEGTALTIDGVEIPMSTFAPWLIRFRGESKAAEFIEYWLLEREARRLGVVVPNPVVRAETDARLAERIRVAFDGDRSRWLEESAVDHRTEKGLRLELDIQVRGELSAAAILGVEREITEEMLTREWRYRHGRGGHTIDARVIEVEVAIPPPPPGALQADLNRQRDEARQLVRETILGFRRRIQEGESFERIAQRYSVHETAARGGVFENGFLAGEFSSEVLDQLEKVPAGKISPPILGMGSWWLFAVDDVRKTPLESVREDIRRELLTRPPTAEDVGNLRRRLLADCEWKVMPAMWAEPGSEPRRLEEVVLEIDGIPIRRAEYTRWLAHYHGEVIAPRFVETYLIEREAKRRGLNMTREEMERRVEEDIALIRLEQGKESEPAWLEFLTSTDRTPESMRRDMYAIRPALYLAEDMMMAEREITDAMIEERWVEKYGEGGHALNARLIRLRVAESIPARNERDKWEKLREIYLEKKEIADRIVERLENGEDFGALARRYSDHPETKMHGGEFPDGLILSDWPHDIVNHLSNLEAGEISDILETETSICIFEILDQRHVPLETVRDTIADELARERPNRVDLATFRNVLMRYVPYSVGPAMSS